MNKDELKNTLRELLAEVEETENIESQETNVNQLLQEILKEIRELKEDQKKNDKEILNSGHHQISTHYGHVRPLSITSDRGLILFFNQRDPLSVTLDIEQPLRHGKLG